MACIGACVCFIGIGCIVCGMALIGIDIGGVTGIGGITGIGCIGIGRGKCICGFTCMAP